MSLHGLFQPIECNKVGISAQGFADLLSYAYAVPARTLLTSKQIHKVWGIKLWTGSEVLAGAGVDEPSCPAGETQWPWPKAPGASFKAPAVWAVPRSRWPSRAPPVPRSPAHYHFGSFIRNPRVPRSPVFRESQRSSLTN